MARSVRAKAQWQRHAMLLLLLLYKAVRFYDHRFEIAILVCDH